MLLERVEGHVHWVTDDCMQAGVGMGTETRYLIGLGAKL